MYSQGKLTETNYGRDPPPRTFTIWLAGSIFKPGITIGETDDFSYNITRDPIHVHDLNTTILHCLGIDHIAVCKCVRPGLTVGQLINLPSEQVDKLLYLAAGRTQLQTAING